MKYTYTLILFFAIQIIIAQELNYNLVVEYQVQWQPDSTNINSKITAEKFILFSGNKNSLYMSSNKLGLDTIINKGANIGDLPKLMAMPQPSSDKVIFKNLTSNLITVYERISSTLYKFDEEINLNWKLYNDTIKIKDIVLKKATASFKGRDYIAWYNDKIPYSDGPYKFKGLPGLIFKIYDTKKHFDFEVLNYKILPKPKKFGIDYNSDSKQTTKKAFTNAKNEYNTNPIPLMESEGAVIDEANKRIIKQRYKERLKKSNNPIELKDNNE